MKKAIVLGHFSTFGDLICLDLVEKQFHEAGVIFDIFAFDQDARESIGNIKEWENVIPEDYEILVVCCGPYNKAMFDRKGILLSKFAHCNRISFNTTMMEPIEIWSPFQFLIERDSNKNKRLDSGFLYDSNPTTSYVTTCFIENQGEYGILQVHNHIIKVVETNLMQNDILQIKVDTKYPLRNNQSGFESVDQFIAVVSRSDFLITNRLHGMIFGFLSGVPVIVIDGIKGGGKVSKQCGLIGWPCLKGEILTDEELNKAIIWARTDEAKNLVTKVVRENRLKAKDNINLLQASLNSTTYDNPYSENFGLETEKQKSQNYMGIRRFLRVCKKTIMLWLDYFRNRI
jgi:hypothetical protein